MGVTYEVIWSGYQPPNLADPAKSARGAAMKGGAKVTSWFALGAQYISLGWKVDTTVARMAPEIKKAQGNKKGVLLVALVKEWPSRNEVDKAKLLHEILIGPAGNDFDEAMRWWSTHDHVHSGPPPGWRLTSIYLWAHA
jgi:hypothetical protein